MYAIRTNGECYVHPIIDEEAYVGPRTDGSYGLRCKQEISDQTHFLPKLNNVCAPVDCHGGQFGVGVSLLKIKVGQDVKFAN
jgi:hypothetical protein